MIVTDLKLKNKPVKLVEYMDVMELSGAVRRRKYFKRNADREWAGGTITQFHEGCEVGSAKYGNRSEPFIQEFANLAVEDYSKQLDYNERVGVLDYEAAMAGDPMCMYGPAIIENEFAPVKIILDNWIQWNIPNHEIERRGVAVMALARALSVFRAVHVTMLAPYGYSHANNSVIQAVPVPTEPMDVNVAAWMLASPLITRQGFHHMVPEVNKKSAQCSLPPLYMGDRWQKTQLGKWYAERQGCQPVFLPMMMTNSPDRKHWKSDKAALGWVKQELGRLMGENSS